MLKTLHQVFLFFIHRVVLYNFLKFIIGVRFQDKEVFKNCNQVLILGNHNSHLDTLSILASLPFRLHGKVHPVAAGDYFGRTSLVSFFSKLFVNVLLINRKGTATSDTKPLNVMDQYIKEGKSLILFPEGSRGEPEKLQEFKIGAAILLQKNPELPFVPVFMRGLGNALPKGDKLLLPHECQVCFGKIKLAEGSAEEIRNLIQQSILDLKSEKEL